MIAKPIEKWDGVKAVTKTLFQGQKVTKQVLFKRGGILHRIDLRYDGSYSFQSYVNLQRWGTAGFTNLMTLSPQADFGWPDHYEFRKGEMEKSIEEMANKLMTLVLD